MTLEKLRELEALLGRLAVLADAEVVRFDRGPEHEPGHDLLKALAFTKLVREAEAIVHTSLVEQTGDTAWLDGGF